MINILLRFVLIIFLYWGISPAFAQQIRHLGVNDGLEGRQTFNIVQDKKGFLWISTRFGVDRYDGLTVKNYPMNIIHYGVIPIRSTRVLLDRDSVLYAYTDRGTIYKYNDRRDGFTPLIDLGIYIRWMHFDQNNRIWITANTELGYIEKDSLIFIESQKLSNENYKSIQDLDNENLLLQTNNNIYTYNLATRQKTQILDISTIKEENLTLETCLYDKNTGRLWIGSVNKGLYLYSFKNKELLSVNDSRLWYHPILSLNIINDNYLFIGTEGVGACLLNTKTLQIEEVYNQHGRDDNYIGGDAVYNIFKDKEKRLWLSTFSDGVYIFDYAEHGFNTIKHQKGNNNSLSRDVICDILEDSDGNMWFATNNDLCLWNRKADKWTRLFDSKNILTLYEDSQHNIWVGTYSSGVYKLSKNGTIISNYVRSADVNKGIDTNFIYAIFEDSQGNMWFGGKRGRLTKFDPKTNSFTHTGISQTNHIIQKDENTILVSSEYGVYKVAVNSTKHEELPFNNKLKSKYISDMYLESDSIIWLASYGDGLNRCNLKTGSIRSFTTKHGLASDIVYSIEDDANGNLWFSTENGIGCFNRKSYKVTNFSVTDGISGNQFRQLSKEKSRNGEIYFGSYDGVTYFNPLQIRKTQREARLSLENFWLFNKIVLPEDKDSPLQDALDKTSEIHLSYKQHSFSVNFTAIDYSENKTRRYTWMLEGMDPDWIEPTNKNMANYTNIPAGNYQLKVRYLDDNNNILDEKSISIHVAPPFWNTIWARILFLVFLIIIAYFIYRYIDQQLKKKQSQEKIKFFINTAHDIRTPLTLINGPIYELKEQIEPSPKTDYLLTLVTNNLNKLNNMFSQLLDFQKTYESQNHLVVKKRDVKKYLSEKSVFWQSSANKKQISFSLILPEQAVEEWFDIEKMEKILDNLVSNAIKYTHEKGSISVKLSTDNSQWRITVKDNGIGISKQDQKNLFKRFYRASNAINSQTSGSGLGLLLIQQYVALHKGTISMTSIENEGSEFHIQFKCGNKVYQDNILLDEQNIPILDDKDMLEASSKTDNLKFKILVVEDNDDLRSYIKLSLSSYYNIYTAENGAVAWDNIPKINPDIIISDLQMPEMDGFELCKKIKTTFETSHIPIILLTVVNDKDHVTEGFNMGVDDYIEKPFDIKHLRLKINNMIQNRKILRQKFLGIDKEKMQIATQINENELNNQFIERATAIIEDNISNTTFSINDFSKEMGLSRTLLYTKFNTITGYTPNDFIRIVRMNKAIKYFKEKKYTINEVALMVGFEEPAYFSTSFKKIYGKSPKQFIDENIL